MKTIIQDLNEIVIAGVKKAFGTDLDNSKEYVTETNNENFGDYQSNVSFTLSKMLHKAPMDAAQALEPALEGGSIIEKMEVVKPGFINFFISKEYLCSKIKEVDCDSELGIPNTGKNEKIIVDYSSPNIAKEMHVGHLRSTIIGDSIVRTYKQLGYDVIKQNHIGDWGTQFGMLIEHLIDLGWKDSNEHTISDLNALYKESKVKFDSDPDFAERSHLRVVKIQSGDKESIDLWKALTDESKKHFGWMYQRMGVLLNDDDYCGESFYNDKLNAVADRLLSEGKAKMSNGAVCLFPTGFQGRDGEPVPLILKKSDGGFGYDATDVTALEYRAHTLNAKKIIYVTDTRQKMHFSMLFQAARDAQLCDDNVELTHVSFGSVLGQDGKPFKTRSGETVTLSSLLDEAEERAKEIILAKNPEASGDALAESARAIGISAIKYADLSCDRIKDYVFNWERMLAFDGNTAPYIQNAYVRCKALVNKGEAQGKKAEFHALTNDDEKRLAKKCMAIGTVVQQAAKTYEPHRLCTYLYDLASSYHSFYEKNPVLSEKDKGILETRLALSNLVSKVLAKGMYILGVSVVEKM
ncbi:MAG: arginine--tRNA ligase [Treponema sp.]|nr:arginine--tRNA ligase [Treponema sp.]